MSGYTRERLRQRLHLDPRRGWIGGVCAGLAGTLATDPAFVRVGFLLSAVFLTKLTVAVYLAAWILLADDDEDRPDASRR